MSRRLHEALRGWHEDTRRAREPLYWRAMLAGLRIGWGEVERIHGRLTQLPDTRRQAEQRGFVEDSLRYLDECRAECARQLWPGVDAVEGVRLRRLIEQGGLEVPE